MYYMCDEKNEEQSKEMSKEDKKMYGDYKGQKMAEEDVKTLVEAGEIRADSDRLKKAVHCAKMQKKYLDSVA